jgi:hypothetical protein
MTSDAERLRKAIDHATAVYNEHQAADYSSTACAAIVKEFGLTRENKVEYDAQYHVGHALTVMYAVLDVAEDETEQHDCQGGCGRSGTFTKRGPWVTDFKWWCADCRHLVKGLC